MIHIAGTWPHNQEGWRLIRPCVKKDPADRYAVDIGDGHRGCAIVWHQGGYAKAEDDRIRVVDFETAGEMIDARRHNQVITFLKRSVERVGRVCGCFRNIELINWQSGDRVWRTGPASALAAIFECRNLHSIIAIVVDDQVRLLTYDGRLPHDCVRLGRPRV